MREKRKRSYLSLSSAPFTSKQSVVPLVVLLQPLSLCFSHSFLSTLDDMPNIAQNPHEVPPLNYELDRFLPAQQPLVDNFHISHEEAAQ